MNHEILEQHSDVSSTHEQATLETAEKNDWTFTPGLGFESQSSLHHFLWLSGKWPCPTQNSEPPDHRVDTKRHVMPIKDLMYGRGSKITEIFSQSCQ